MSKRFYDIAKRNYPNNWNIEMLRTLLELGRLTQKEYDDIVGEDE